MPQERSSEAQAVSLALVEAFANNDIGYSPVEAMLDSDGHEEAISGAVAVFEECTLTSLEQVVKKKLLSGLCLPRRFDISINHHHDELLVVVNLGLFHKRGEGCLHLDLILIVAGQQHDKLFELVGCFILDAKNSAPRVCPCRRDGNSDGEKDLGEGVDAQEGKEDDVVVFEGCGGPDHDPIDRHKKKK